MIEKIRNKREKQNKQTVPEKETMNLTRSCIVVVVGVTVSMISMVLSSFFYLSAVRERNLIASITIEQQQQQQQQYTLLLRLVRMLRNREDDNEEQEENIVLSLMDEANMMDQRLLKNNNSNKKKTHQESFIILCQPGKFLPPPGSPESPDPLYYDGFTGSQLVLRGIVFDGKAYTLNEILDEGPKKMEDSYYTQKCMVVKGKTNIYPNQIVENMCEFTLCYKHPTNTKKKGCLYLHSASKFEFQPGVDDDADAIPTVKAVIIGGSGHFENYYGGAVIKVVLRSNQNDAEYIGFRVSLYYKKQNSYPKYDNTKRSNLLDDNLRIDRETGLVKISDTITNIVNKELGGKVENENDIILS